MSTAMPLDDLAGEPRWVVWRSEARQDDPEKMTKVPYQPDGRKASTINPQNWVNRAKAEAAVETIVNGQGGGIGIVLGELGDDAMLAGVDLDSCRRDDGSFEPWAQAIVERFVTYAEISPSGKGAKLFFVVKIEDFEAIKDLLNASRTGRQFKRAGGGDHPPGFEIYFTGRYFAVTEQHLAGTPGELATIGADDLRWLITEAGPALAGNGNGQSRIERGSGPKDGSRSGAAFRLGMRMHRAGKTFDEFRAALQRDPETADWFREKGEANGEREIKRIWTKAAEQPSGPPWNIDLRAPYDTARLLLEVEFSADGSPTLCRHRGVFYAWNGTAFPEVTDAEIRAQIYGFLDQCVVTVTDPKTGKSEDVPVRPNARIVNDVADALRAAALLPDAVAAPAWLDDTKEPEPGESMACANGLLHLPTLELLPHSPAFFTQNALDYAYDPAAPRPVSWLAFLSQLWPEDAESIATLREIFGYCLAADTSQQKAFLVVGPKRSGKGTIARVLARLVGSDNTVAPALAGLGTNFGLQPLIGRRVAIVSDARLGGRADQSVIAERLLSITGEDAITIDRKYREPWTGKLGVRFLVLTNELPRLADASGALASRFIVLVLTESFYGREDRGLTDKLLPELPGILNWSIGGWRRLRRRGHFLQPASARDAIDDLDALGSPVGAFVRARCEVGAGKRENVNKVFREWRDWCDGQGRDKPGTAQTFGRDLRAAVPGLRVRQKKNGDRFYEGVGLRTLGG
jgi:putative DNA primase/helicase